MIARVAPLVAGLALVAGLSASAAAQVLVPIPAAPPAGVSAIAWHEVPSDSLAIRGTVVRDETLQPLATAVVRISDRAGVVLWQTAVPPAGRLAWTAPRQGRYTITVVSIGHAVARTQVELRGSRGVSFTAVVAPQRSHLGTVPSERSAVASPR